MKITIERNLLLEKINLVAHALPTRTPLPILTGILIEVTKEEVEFTASNSDISIKTKTIIDKNVEVINDDQTRIVVPGKMFNEIIKNLKANTVTLETDGNVLSIKAGRGKYQLHMLDSNNYPSIDFTINEEENIFKLPFKTFSEITSKVIISTATSEKKPILTGVNFKDDEGKLAATATDSFRLSRCEVAEINISDINITIPANGLSELIKCGNENDIIEIEIFKNKMTVLLNSSNTIFVTRLLEGAYPDTKRLIKGNINTVLEINRSELLAVADRVSIMSPSDNVKDKEITSNVMKLELLSNETIRLTSKNNMIGDASEELPLINKKVNEESANTFKEMYFSGRYFIDAIKTFKSDIIKININTNVLPFTITSDKEPELTQLVLPVRMS